MTPDIHLSMQQLPATVIVGKLEALIDNVEGRIDDQRAHMNRDMWEEEETLRDMLDTLEQLRTYRDRFYSTLH